MISVLFSLVLASTVLAQSMRQYTIYNQCPTTIDLYIGGVLHGTIPANGNIIRTLSTGAGFFYTDANGGSSTAVGTIRAGFYDTDYYYMVADPNYVNTGLQVKPVGRTPSNGFCEAIECDSRGCPEAFSQPPTGFPPPASTAPSPPYYRCPVANTDYAITFCPTGTFPDQGQPIYFDYSQNKCLDVRGGVFANGTPVQIYDCNGTQAQRWIINSGSLSQVQVAGTNFCLDIGIHPADGEQLEIWECHDHPAELWYYTNDDTLENQGFCMDLANGVTTNGNKVQSWTCIANNKNQVWTL